MVYDILIVDDSATMRKVIIRTLKMAELPLGEILEAASGKEALETLQQRTVDIILADINMPEMSGIEMTEILQADENTRSIPVIVVSTEASTTRIDDLKQIGVKGYVHKPFTPEAIRNVVNDVLGACHVGNK